jgi:hypothetical protein
MRDGVVLFKKSNGLEDEVVMINYQYGQRRFDAVDVDAAGQVHYTEGTASAKPQAPDIASGRIRLYLIERIPFQSSVVHDCRTFVPTIRDVVDVTAADVDAGGDGTNSSVFTANRVSYADPDGFTDTDFRHWALSTYRQKPYAFTSSRGCSVCSQIYAKSGDSLYLRTSYTNDYVRVKIEIEVEPGSDIFKESYREFNSTAPAVDKSVVLYTGLTEGYHKVRITNEGSGVFYFWGFVIGRSEMQYTNHEDSDSSVVATTQTVETALQVGNRNVAAAKSLPVPMAGNWRYDGEFKNEIYLFDANDGSYLICDEDNTTWTQGRLPQHFINVRINFTPDYLMCCDAEAETLYYTADGLNWEAMDLPIRISVGKILTCGGFIYLTSSEVSDTLYRISSGFQVIESCSLPVSMIWQDMILHNHQYLLLSESALLFSSTGLSEWSAVTLPAVRSWQWLFTQPLDSRLVVVAKDTALAWTDAADVSTVTAASWSLAQTGTGIVSAVYKLQDLYHFLVEGSDKVITSLDFQFWEMQGLNQALIDSVYGAGTSSIYTAPIYGSTLFIYKNFNALTVHGRTYLDGDVFINGDVIIRGYKDANPNLLQNGGMDLLSGSVPSNWSVGAVSGTAPVLSQHQLLGSEYLQVGQGLLNYMKVTTPVGSTVTEWWVNNTTVAARKYRGCTLTATTWIRSNRAGDVFRLKAVLKNVGADVVVFDREVTVTAADVFVNFQETFVIPELADITWSGGEVLEYGIICSASAALAREVDVTGCKIEVGSVSTRFSDYAGEELASSILTQANNYALTAAKSAAELVVPVGAVIPIDTEFGAAVVDSTRFVSCDGQVINCVGSVWHGRRARNLNGANVSIQRAWANDVLGAYSDIFSTEASGLNEGDWVVAMGLPANTQIKSLMPQSTTLVRIMLTAQTTSPGTVVDTVFTNDGVFLSGGSYGSGADQMQGWQLGSTADALGEKNYFGNIQQRDRSLQVSIQANYGELQLNTGAQGVAAMLKAVNDGTNGPIRSGKEPATAPADEVIYEGYIRCRQIDMYAIPGLKSLKLKQLVMKTISGLFMVTLLSLKHELR